MPPQRKRLSEKQVSHLISLGTFIKQAFKLRVRRINRWMANGFTRQEALNLTALKSTNKWTGVTTTVAIPTTRPYARAMMRHRATMLRQAQRDHISADEYRKRVYDYYKNNEWLTPDNRPDYWAEIRHYQRETDYAWHGTRSPYDPSKPHKKTATDGGIDYMHIRKQSKGYREQRKPPMNKSTWISQLKQTIEKTTSKERIAQLRKQLENLERS